MPLSLKQIRAQVVTAPIEVMGETVHLGFAPGRYTADVDEKISALMDSFEPDAETLTLEQNAGVRELLLALLVEWDVLDEDDEPLPIDEEHLRLLPPPILITFIGALSAANQPDPQMASPSNDSADTEPTSSGPSPTGI